LDYNIDNELIIKASNGDIPAFEAIVYAFEKKVYQIAYSIFKNEQDAYDTSQEVFIKLYKKIDTFHFDSAFSTWVHKIAFNTCIDEYRKKKKHFTDISINQTYPDEKKEIYEQIEDTSPLIEDIIITNEGLRDIRIAINKLKEEQRAVIILREIQGFQYEEIALILECSVGTVKSRIARARKNLREILDSQ